MVNQVSTPDLPSEYEIAVWFLDQSDFDQNAYSQVLGQIDLQALSDSENEAIHNREIQLLREVQHPLIKGLDNRSFQNCEDLEILYNWWKVAHHEQSVLTNVFLSHYFIRYFFSINNLESISEIYAFDYLVQAPHSNAIVFSKMMLTRALIESGKYSQALRANDVLLMSEMSNITSKIRRATIQLERAYLLQKMGFFDESLKQYLNIYDLIYEIDRPSYYTSFFNSLGSVYFKLGRYHEYIELQLKAVAYAREYDDVEYLVHSLFNLYKYYVSTESWYLAEQYLEEANQIFDILSPESKMTLVLSNARMEWMYSENYSMAADLFLEAINLADDQLNTMLRIRPRTDYAEMLRSKSDYESALQIQKEIANLAKESGLMRSYFESKFHQAHIHMDSGDYNAASFLLTEASDIELHSSDFNLSLFKANAEARHLLSEGDLEQAYDIMKPLVQEVLERLRISLDVQSGFSNQFKWYLDAFSLYAEILYHKEKDSELLQFLNHQANISGMDIRKLNLQKEANLSVQDRELERELSRKILRLRNTIRHSRQSQLVTLQEEFLEAQNARNKLYQKAGIMELSGVDADISALQNQLSSDELLLYFSKVDTYVYIHAIHKKGLTSRRVLLEAGELTSIKEQINAMQDGNTDLQFLFGLYGKLVKPFISDQFSSIIVIPDHFLHHIPLEILPVTEPAHSKAYGSTEYLIEQMSVSYRNSLYEMYPSDVQTKSTPQHELLAFGVSRTSDTKSLTNSGAHIPVLNFADAEVTAVSKALGGSKEHRIFTNQHASVANFLEHVSESKILHLATHSEISFHDPLFSVIYFAGESEKNHIYAHELFDLNVNSDLIVLSSCDSGAGTYRRGAGISGLSSTLRLAGAKSMMMNLWPVRDQTAARLTSTFYEELANGHSKSKALQKAKLKYLNHYNSDPYHWGAMTLYGDDSPIYRYQIDYKLLLLMLFSGFGLIIVYLKRSHT